MKHVILGFAVAAILGSAANATTVLYRVDFSVGTDRMASAISSLGYTVTTTAGDLSAFTLSDYDIVVYANQNDGLPGSDVTALENHVAGGGKLIFTDWTSSGLFNLGGGFTGNTNEDEVTVGALFATGLGNPLTLTNPGWGVFSTGLFATTASIEGTFGNGEAAILLGNGGRTIWNGFLFDTVDTDQLFVNQLTYLAVIPEPATWGMMIGGFGLVGFAARRRRAAHVAA